jgi:hypothetical protein
VSAKPLDDILEKEWDATLFNSQRGLAPMLGWRLCYHTLRSKGSQSGFPDRVLVLRGRIIFAELKREKKVATPVSAHQREWLDGLAAGGAEVYLWRPSDLEEIGEILSARHTIAPLFMIRKYRSAWWNGCRRDEAEDLTMST